MKILDISKSHVAHKILTQASKTTGINCFFHPMVDPHFFEDDQRLVNSIIRNVNKNR